MVSRIDTMAQNGSAMEDGEEMKHAHYFKDVSRLKSIDVYRVMDLFDVTDSAISHAAKKLLAAGSRGVKDKSMDIREAIETLERWEAMRLEDMQLDDNGS